MNFAGDTAAKYTQELMSWVQKIPTITALPISIYIYILLLSIYVYFIVYICVKKSLRRRKKCTKLSYKLINYLIIVISCNACHLLMHHVITSRSLSLIILSTTYYPVDIKSCRNFHQSDQDRFPTETS